MEEYLKNINLSVISNQTLAFIGDSVYDLYIRTYLASKSTKKTGLLHKEATRYVSAKAQAMIIDKIMDNLTEEEIEIYKRGRNTSIQSISKNADITEYKKATGFEALIGRIYIEKKTERLEELINIAIEIAENRR